MQAATQKSSAQQKSQSKVYASKMARVAAGAKKLDPSVKSDDFSMFESGLQDRIIGQPEAIKCVCTAYQTYLSGLSPVGRPIAVLMFAGSTGVGKTKVAEASAELLFGSPGAVTKVDCAEYQLQHEIARLTGSPPGYTGFKETTPIFSQKHIDKYQATSTIKCNLILFDEIEKAHEGLWNLLLSIMDKGRITLGDVTETDFTKSFIIMTTNLGASEMDRLLTGSYIGFAKQDSQNLAIENAAVTAVNKRFTPEFLNRIDHTVVFNRLTKEHYIEIVKIELNSVQNRILNGVGVPIFTLRWTDSAVALLLEHGIKPRYGARELKRAVERLIVLPLSSLIATKQISEGDIVTADSDGDEITFSSRPGKIL